MEIKTQTLVSFLDKAKMTDSQQISEAVLDFGSEGLKINANSPTHLSRTMSWLKPSAFKKYTQLGKIGMNDLENVSKVLGRFGENIQCKHEGNLLTVSGDKKKVDVELISENFLSSDTGEPKLEFDEVFSLPISKLKEIIKDVTMNKDAQIVIETEPKLVKITNTGKYKFVNMIDAPTVKGGTKVKFGKPFIDAVNKLDSDLEINLKSDYPVKIIERTQDSVITIIVAPMIETGEE